MTVYVVVDGVAVLVGDVGTTSIVVLALYSSYPERVGRASSFTSSP